MWFNFAQLIRHLFSPHCWVVDLGGHEGLWLGFLYNLNLRRPTHFFSSSTTLFRKASGQCLSHLSSPKSWSEHHSGVASFLSNSPSCDWPCRHLRCFLYLLVGTRIKSKLARSLVAKSGSCSLAENIERWRRSAPPSLIHWFFPSLIIFSCLAMSNQLVVGGGTL